MDIREFQDVIEKMYTHRDRQRGSAGTYLWLAEEVGELAAAIANDDKENIREELADVFAWLVTIANIEQVDLNEAIRKYTDGCPGCGKMECHCNEKA